MQDPGGSWRLACAFHAYQMTYISTYLSLAEEFGYLLPGWILLTCSPLSLAIYTYNTTAALSFVGPRLDKDTLTRSPRLALCSLSLQAPVRRIRDSLLRSPADGGVSAGYSWTSGHQSYPKWLKQDHLHLVSPSRFQILAPVPSLMSS